MFQLEDLSEIMNPITTMFILIVLMFVMIVLYLKVRYFLAILLVFLFSLILGVLALEIEIPLTPYFQILFILFQLVIFLITAIEISKDRYKEVSI